MPAICSAGKSGVGVGEGVRVAVDVGEAVGVLVAVGVADSVGAVVMVKVGEALVVGLGAGFGVQAQANRTTMMVSDKRLKRG